MQPYLFNVAINLIGKLRVREQLNGEFPRGYGYVERFWQAVRTELRKWTPETLGKLAALGTGRNDDEKQLEQSSPRRRTSLYELHCGVWLGKHDSGKTLLLDIATSTALAAIKDVIDLDDQHKRKAG